MISLVVLAMSALSRLSFLHTGNLADHPTEIIGMLVGGISAAWFGASLLTRIPKTHIMGVIAVQLLGRRLAAPDDLSHMTAARMLEG